ncbi:MAG TPA: AraD1 family protein [Nitrososphaerales archaeon]|nr:AraD1 family protein [Nitrososphaerales archaeon]
MRLVQFEDSNGTTKVGLVSADGNFLLPLKETSSTYELAMDAIRLNCDLENLVKQKVTEDRVVYDDVVSEKRLLTPLTHPDPAHCIVSGTGLNHLGSAMARDAMHSVDPGKVSDSMKMFKLGLEGGKPPAGQIGAQPEWFYKGDGSWIVPPGHSLELPTYALDGGEEAEVVGLYVISNSGEVFRLGFALGNEYSDHVLERENYLYLAHSKLRECSFGPELLVGRLPENVTGSVRLVRDGETIWSSSFLTGEGNMTHSISNIEFHHFKYARFRRPGDVHCHFLGASVLSYSAGVVARPGDIFEISSPQFGRPLSNRLEKGEADFSMGEIRPL